MRFGKLDIDPSTNPAVLHTAMWDPDEAWSQVKGLDEAAWRSLRDAAREGKPLPEGDGVTPHTPSRVRWQDSVFCLATLQDKQQVFLEIGAGKGQSVLGAPVATLSFGGGEQVAMYETDADTVAAFVRTLNPDMGPEALGDTPRLGIGNRMSTAVWPGIFRAMVKCDFAANAIQNSMRELNLLDDLMEGRPAEKNYGPNLGTLEAGHTGSTFMGLWVYGVLEALKSEGSFRYGADADHLQVKRGDDTMSRTKRVLDATRYYTFYTMDVSDILEYRALDVGPAEGEAYLDQIIGDGCERRDVIAYHREKLQVGGKTYQADENTIGRLVGKYWVGLDAMEVLTSHVDSLKGGEPFDLEFTLDETPADVSACSCITSDEELIFVVRETQRRGLPVTHVACNFGIEKEMDYRCPDGIEGMEKRVCSQTRIAKELGIILDFHSGDDLSSETRQAIGRASGGDVHFKVSPWLQLLFAETLADIHPDVFRLWWDDTMSHVRGEAEAGSPLAVKGLQSYEAASDRGPSAYHMAFRHYCFASVGRRNAEGQFVLRERLYDVSGEFFRQYHERVVKYLCVLADDLFHQG